MHFTITPSAPNQIKYTKNLNIEELKYWPARCVLEVDGTSRGKHTSCQRGRGKPYHARAKTLRPLARYPDPPISWGGGQGWRGGGRAEGTAPPAEPPAPLPAVGRAPASGCWGGRRGRTEVAGAASTFSVRASSASRAAFAEPAPLLRF